MENSSVLQETNSSVFKSYSNDLSYEFAADVTSSAADIAFIIDENLEIVEVTHCDGSVIPLSVNNWVGKKWTDTVTTESRQKLLRLVESDAGVRSITPWMEALTSPSATWEFR